MNLSSDEISAKVMIAAVVTLDWDASCSFLTRKYAGQQLSGRRRSLSTLVIRSFILLVYEYIAMRKRVVVRTTVLISIFFDR